MTANTPKKISELDASGALALTDIIPVVRPGGGTNTQKATFTQVSTLLGGSYLQISNNLDDLDSAATARTNLGLGTAAVVNTGTGASDVPTTTEADARYLLESNNLSDLDSASTARTNLGLGTAAVEDATSGTWTATVQGSGTAGTYEIASQISTYYRIGKMYFVSTSITMAGSLSGGGVGALNITGLPATKKANMAARGAADFSNVNVANDTVQVVARFASDSSASAVIEFHEMKDDGDNNTVAISAIAANDVITFSIAYEVA